MNVAILGAGNMGGALAQGLLRSGVSADNLVLTCRSPEKYPHWTAQGITLLSDNAAAVATADVVIIAVKPWQVADVLKGVSESLKPESVVISVAAGVTVVQLQAALPPQIDAVRAMPNTAVAQIEGVIATTSTSKRALTVARELFSPLGLVVEIEEGKMDALTALAGCGIAHALRFLRAAQCAGVQMGLSAEQSVAVFAQVMAGAIALMKTPGASAEAEIDRICTPGGLTIRGLNALEQAGFSAAVVQGLMASLPKETK